MERLGKESDDVKSYDNKNNKDQLEDAESVEKKNCSICMEAIAQGTGFKWPNCNHIFHKECATKWMTESNNCPLCRKHNGMIQVVKEQLVRALEQIVVEVHVRLFNNNGVLSYDTGERIVINDPDSIQHFQHHVSQNPANFQHVPRHRVSQGGIYCCRCGTLIPFGVICEGCMIKDSIEMSELANQDQNANSQGEFEPQIANSNDSTDSSKFNIGEVGKEDEISQRLLATQKTANGNNNIHSNILNLQQDTANCSNDVNVDSDSNILKSQQDTVNNNNFQNLFDSTLQEFQNWNDLHSDSNILNLQQDTANNNNDFGHNLYSDSNILNPQQDTVNNNNGYDLKGNREYLQKLGWETSDIKSLVDRLKPNKCQEHADVIRECDNMVNTIISTLKNMEETLDNMGFVDAFTSQQVSRALLETKNLNVDQAVNHLLNCFYAD